MKTLDALVSNAGVILFQPVAKFRENLVVSSISILWVFYLFAAIPMLEKGGSIGNSIYRRGITEAKGAIYLSSASSR